MQAKDIVRDAAAKYFQAPLSEVFVFDEIGARFPWSKQHRFFTAANMERRKVLMVLDPAHVAHVFRPVNDLAHVSQARDNVDLLNKALRAEGVELPHGLDLGWTLRNALCLFGGNVASRKFLEEQRGALAMWATYRPQDGARLFEECCTDPVLRIHEEDWELSFRYFNMAGGVEEWSAAGNRHQIVNYSARQLLPNRTFMPPFF